jgi:hypothetical protein
MIINAKNSLLPNREDFLPKIYNLNLNEEIEILSNIKLKQNKIKQLYKIKILDINNKIGLLKKKYDIQIEKIKNLYDYDTTLKINLENLENEFNKLSNQLENLNHLKKTLNDQILSLRKSSTEIFDLEIKKNEKNNNEIKKLKKEFNLLVNILKYRLLNIKEINGGKRIEGYMIDIDRNLLKYREFDLNEINIKQRYLNFWKDLKNFLE